MAESFPLRIARFRRLAAACDALTSVLLPADCRLCQRLLLHASRIPICGECIASFPQTPEKICNCCGLPLADMAAVAGTEILCAACREGRFAFERARSFGLYEGTLVRAIMLLKFERMEPLGEWFAEQMEGVVAQQAGAMKADIVVPVPLHWDRQKERGYNQAEMLSRPLAKRLGLPHRGALLVRTKPRPDKHILTLHERWEAVRGAFATQRGSQVDNLRVLLVDDVMTTGATLDACARALRGAGAKEVRGLTIARARRSPL